MNKKLTLLLDEITIENAKQYAERNNKSLSEMVESYFRYLTRTKAPRRHRQPSQRGLVAELSGMISLPDSIDIKAEYREHRAEKILRG